MPLFFFPKVRFPSIPHGHWWQTFFRVYTVFLPWKARVHPHADLYLSSSQRSKFGLLLWQGRTGDGHSTQSIWHPAWEWGTPVDLQRSPSETGYTKTESGKTGQDVQPSPHHPVDLTWLSPHLSFLFSNRRSWWEDWAPTPLHRDLWTSKKRNIIEFCENK